MSGIAPTMGRRTKIIKDMLEHDAPVYHWLDRAGGIGRQIFRVMHEYRVSLFTLYTTVKAAVFERRKAANLIGPAIANQIYFTGVDRLPAIVFASLLMGVVVQGQLIILLSRWGMKEEIYSMTIIILLRELAPLLVALFLIGGSGTAITTELALLNLNGEIDLWKSIGANLDYLFILPRWIGMLVSGVMLTALFAFLSIVGGFLLVHTLHIAQEWYIAASLFAVLSRFELLVVTFKTILFTTVTNFIHCTHGFQVRSSITEVPAAAGRSVVQSVITVFLINVIVDLVTYIL